MPWRRRTVQSNFTLKPTSVFEGSAKSGRNTSTRPPSTYHARPGSVAKENPIRRQVPASVADMPGSAAVVSVSKATRGAAMSVRRRSCASSSVET